MLPFDFPLQISVAVEDLKYLQMDLIPRNRIRFAFNPNHMHIENPERPKLTLKHIMYWPGMTLHLNLGRVRLTHSVIPNFKRSLIIGGHTMRDVASQSKRSLHPHRVVTNKDSTDKSTELSVEMLNTFFTMIQSVDFGDVAKRTQFKPLFGTLEVNMRPMKTILLNQKYSCFLTENQYARYYLNSTDCRVPTRHSMASDQQMVRLLEIINPEAHFQITECPFVQNGDDDVWAQDLFNYFDRLLTKRCPKALAEFNEMLGKSMSFECTICQVEFNDGDHALRDSIRHVQKEHCSSPNWNCAECDMTYDTFKLAENKWRHHCG